MQYTIGTKVVIVSERPDHSNWVRDMDRHLGQVMTISSYFQGVYKMKESGWSWNECFIDHEATAKLNSPIAEPEYTDGYGVDYYTDKVYNMFADLDRKGILFADDCQYSKEGICANVKEWYNRKSRLFSLFSKHPNWNEEAKAIVFLKTEHREPDVDLFENYFYELLSLRFVTFKACDGKYTTPEKLMKQLHDSEPWNERCEAAGELFSHWTDHENSINENDVLRNISNRIKRMETVNTLSEELAGIINGFYPDIKAKAGMKTSRAVNKLFAKFGFDKLSEYNRLFAKLSDSLNPFDVERITVFSLNIIDFLLMSNGNSWRSCHTIINDNVNDNYGGCFKGGTLSYANDGESIIMYTIDKNYNGTDWCFEPKITRQIFFWDYPVLVQERLYPQCNDNCKQGYSLMKQYRTIAEDIIAVCLGTPNLWVKENKDRAVIMNRCDTYMYPDWEHYTNHIIHIKKEIVISDSEIEEGNDTNTPSANYVVRSAKTIAVGGKSFCTKCGGWKNADDYDDPKSPEETLLCASCCEENMVKCADCGCMVDREDAYLADGEYYCNNCCAWCDYHERYEPNCENEFVYVENYGYICEDALDCGNFYCCDHCGVWYYGIDSMRECEGDVLCESCFDDKCDYCCECGEPMYIRNMNDVDGNFYCDCCAESIRQRELSESETAYSA